MNRRDEHYELGAVFHILEQNVTFIDRREYRHTMKKYISISLGTDKRLIFENWFPKVFQLLSWTE